MLLPLVRACLADVIANVVAAVVVKLGKILSKILKLSSVLEKYN